MWVATASHSFHTSLQGCFPHTEFGHRWYNLTPPVLSAEVCHVSYELVVIRVDIQSLQAVKLELRLSLFGKVAQFLTPRCNIGQARGLSLSASLFRGSSSSVCFFKRVKVHVVLGMSLKEMPLHIFTWSGMHSFVESHNISAIQSLFFFFFFVPFISLCII